VSWSPLPAREVLSGADLFPGDEKREGRWYFVVGRQHAWWNATLGRWIGETEPAWACQRKIRGGPFSSREEAEAHMSEYDRALDELYERVEEEARREGRTVAW